MKKFIYLGYFGLYMGSALFSLTGVQAAESKTTTSDETITVSGQHVVLRILGDMIRITEVLILDNRSEATLVSTGGSKVLSFNLPEGFFAPQFLEEMADAVSITDRGFDYNKPIAPGELKLAVSYHVKISSFPYTLSIKTSYPTKLLDVFIADSDTQVESPQLVAQPPVQMGDQLFRRYAGENFDKGVVIPIKLIPGSGKGQPGSGLPDSNASRIVPLPPEEQQDNQRQSLIVSVLVSILIVGGILSVYVKNRLSKNKRKSGSPRNPKLSLKQEREELIRVIAELDDRFEAGDITEENYHKERARKKKKLIELTRTLLEMEK